MPEIQVGHVVPTETYSLTPEQATAKLAELAAVQRGPAPTPPAAGEAPSAVQAKAQLAVLKADREWVAAYLRGDIDARRQFAELTAAIAAGDEVASAIAGTATPPEGLIEVTHEGELNYKNTAAAIAMLRETGLRDEVIAESFVGGMATPQEIAAVRQRQRMRHGDAEWVKRLLAGDYACKREQMLMSIVLSGAG